MLLANGNALAALAVLARSNEDPLEALEQPVIAVAAHPDRARLDGEGCEPGVGYEVPACVGLAAEAAENAPVPGARFDPAETPAVDEVITKGQRFQEWSRWRENAGVGRDAYKSRQDAP